MSVRDSTIRVDAKHLERRYLFDLWAYRDLLYILVWRDIKVRYKQTLLGGLWALIRPTLTMLIFSFVFGRVAGLAASETLPYYLVVFGGVLAWQLIGTSISIGANAIVANERLITKVYFPRVLLPLSGLGVCLLDFFISLLLLLALVWFELGSLSWTLLLLPLWLILACLPILGLVFGLSAMNVRYRDFRYALPFLLQVGLFVSPVGFTTERIPFEYAWLYQLNPAVGIIESFRWCIFGQHNYPLDSAAVAYSLGIGIGILLLGYWYFRRTERTFADQI
jgi:lipopolysaccharide transport system permease protein